MQTKPQPAQVPPPQPPMEPPPQPPAGPSHPWVEKRTSDGRAYYYNKDTGQSTYNRPAVMDEPASSAHSFLSSLT